MRSTSGRLDPIAMKLTPLVPCALLLLAGCAQAPPPFSAGVARVKITPPMPFQLSGYSNRTNLATEVRTDLWAKALALRAADGSRAVIVTTDLIGLPREISEDVAARAMAKHGLERAQILLNSSHTHSGPMVRPNLPNLIQFTDGQTAAMDRYARALADNLLAVIDAAIADLAPARAAFAQDTAGFAVNRREPTPKGVRLGVNPDGPVDHDVPVLAIRAPDGTIRAALFGYACHNTTLTGTWNMIDGDYAGAAQREIEAAHPGCTALFMMLCGGDQNPNPRTALEHVDLHGKALAAAVGRALAKDPLPLRPPIRAAHAIVPLPFASHDRETFLQELEDKNPSRRRRAQMMLDAYDRGAPIREVPYPVQAIRFGADLCLLGLGGEVVVDYSLETKRRFPRENLIVAGYCNDVMCYIPTARIIREGGYEPCDSMVYYGQPGPFDESVEATISATILKVMRDAGARMPQNDLYN